jgi:hypothetical protein
MLHAKRSPRPTATESRASCPAAPGCTVASPAMEPGPGIGPVLVSGRAREADDLGRVFNREAAEVAELDELGRLRVLPSELLQRRVDFDQLIDRLDIRRPSCLGFNDRCLDVSRPPRNDPPGGDPGGRGERDNAEFACGLCVPCAAP